ncbi:MAG: formate dehydrogenase, partial [Thermoplasmata archaeon]|nr:formate dehydrogenase [Thermoplasmata archaeon]
MKIVWISYPCGPAAQAVPELLGCAENALGLRDFVRSRGHELVSTTETGPALDPILADATVVIATPFWPAYITRERLAHMPQVKLLLTAGVGSDHFDLAAAGERGLTVAEITGSNVVSVAEHVIMQILALVRNFIPGYLEVVQGGWDIAKVAARSHDLEDKTVGIVGMGRIGQRVALRLRPFGVEVYYYDNRRLTTAEEEVLGVRYRSLDALLPICDVISINAPLTPATDRLF